MSFARHNTELTEAAAARVRTLADALESAGVEARFTIHYDGFGAGGTAGIGAGNAIRYLHSLADLTQQNHRFRTAIKSIDIEVRHKPIIFS